MYRHKSQNNIDKIKKLIYKTKKKLSQNCQIIISFNLCVVLCYLTVTT